MTDWAMRVYQKSCEEMSEIPDGSVQCCVTSPPYYGLRDYGVDGQIGLEPTLDDYVTRLVRVFREVRRTLRDDGTLWLNLGDSYAGSWGAQGRDGAMADRSIVQARSIDAHPKATHTGTMRDRGLKPKDLMGVPWRVAFALQADGWWLRDAIVWAKPNPMPSSVTDRCTSSYEMVFMLAKSARYFADMDAVRELSAYGGTTHTTTEKSFGTNAAGRRTNPTGNQIPGTVVTLPEKANLRNVWTIATTPFADAHFATFPMELATRCIRIGTSEAGCCSKCGASRLRQTERETRHLSGSGISGNEIVGKNTGESTRGQIRADHDLRTGPTSSVRTLGFAPSCECDAPTIGSVVLDPFMGSGTTAEAAEAIGRRWVGYEISGEYHKLITERTRQVGLL